MLPSLVLANLAPNCLGWVQAGFVSALVLDQKLLFVLVGAGDLGDLNPSWPNYSPNEKSYGFRVIKRHEFLRLWRLFWMETSIKSCLSFFYVGYCSIDELSIATQLLHNATLAEFSMLEQFCFNNSNRFLALIYRYVLIYFLGSGGTYIQFFSEMTMLMKTDFLPWQPQILPFLTLLYFSYVSGFGMFDWQLHANVWGRYHKTMLRL